MRHAVAVIEEPNGHIRYAVLPYFYMRMQISKIRS